MIIVEVLGLAFYGCLKLDIRVFGVWGWGGVGGSRMEVGKLGVGRFWRSMWGVKRWVYVFIFYFFLR